MSLFYKSSPDKESYPMGTFSQSQSDLHHLAPEVVQQQHDAPEVVPEESYPQAVTKQSSLLQPEYYHQAPYYKHEYSTYSSDGDHYEHSLRPIYGEHGGQIYAVGSQDVREKPNGRRCCGMRKATFIIAVIAVVLLCIGIILGAVLGTVLPKESSGSQLQSISMTGLATAVSGNTMYQYFQDPGGKILENSYVDGDWTLKQGGNMDDALVTGEAGAGSPIAAIAYPYKGQNYRQVFYITSTGEVRTVNRTETGSWGSSSLVTTDKANPGSIALAACWSDKLMNGIRVYYASQWGYIQEVGREFGNNPWTPYESFYNGDVNSGVACTIKNDASDQYLNVYVRNKAASRVYQHFWDFVYPGSWSRGPISWGNQTIPQGADIAACNDGVDTEYVFFQLTSGLITRGVMNPSMAFYETFKNFQGATVGSKLAASYYKEGASIMFQNRSSDSAMWVSDVSRNDVPIFNIAVT